MNNPFDFGLNVVKYTVGKWGSNFLALAYFSSDINYYEWYIEFKLKRVEVKDVGKYIEMKGATFVQQRKQLV